MLGIYLGGLSLGYALFGRVTAALVRRAAERGEPPPLALAYGVIEAAIGVWAWLFPALFALAQALSFRLLELPIQVPQGLLPLLAGPPLPESFP